jgi:hypothetical protein
MGIKENVQMDFDKSIRYIIYSKFMKINHY